MLCHEPENHNVSVYRVWEYVQGSKQETGHERGSFGPREWLSTPHPSNSRQMFLMRWTRGEHNTMRWAFDWTFYKTQVC